jgi:hypothetical protein
MGKTSIKEKMMASKHYPNRFIFDVDDRVKFIKTGVEGLLEKI